MLHWHTLWFLFESIVWVQTPGGCMQACCLSGCVSHWDLAVSCWKIAPCDCYAILNVLSQITAVSVSHGETCRCKHNVSKTIGAWLRRRGAHVKPVVIVVFFYPMRISLCPTEIKQHWYAGIVVFWFSCFHMKYAKPPFDLVERDFVTLHSSNMHGSLCAC